MHIYPIFPSIRSFCHCDGWRHRGGTGALLLANLLAPQLLSKAQKAAEDD